MSRAIALSLLLAGLAACDRGADAPAAPAPVQAAERAALDESLIQAMAADPALTTFVSGLQQAGLTEVLASGGPYTVFAPTNAAFEAIPVEAREALARPENAARLRAGLAAHIAPARLDQAELARRVQAGGGQLALPTLQGSGLTIVFDQGQLVLVGPGGGRSALSPGEHVAANGVVHKIDVAMSVNQSATGAF